MDGFSPPSAEAPPEIGHAELPPKPKPAPTHAAPAVPSSFFTVQVRATQSKDDAGHFLSKLKGEGFHAFVTEVDIEGKGHWYRVRVGKFDTRAKAEAYLSDFKRETKLQAFVTAAGH
jgi:cell division septation protein DedD